MSKYDAQILEIVSLRGRIRVLDLARELNVSDQTVRRVVQPLVTRGDISKVHGALISTRSALDPPFLARMTQNRTAKIAIAREIAQIVRDGDSIAIDTGSTSAFAAQALRVRRNLTVVTNSAFVASTLAMIPGNNVSMAGTQLRDHDGAAFDRSAFEVIERMQVDFALLSASIVDPQQGFLVHEQCEVDIATAMIRNAGRTIMAVDTSKFSPPDRRPAMRQPQLGPGDYLITEATVGCEFAAITGALIHIVAEQNRRV